MLRGYGQIARRATIVTIQFKHQTEQRKRPFFIARIDFGAARAKTVQSQYRNPNLNVNSSIAGNTEDPRGKRYVILT